MTRRAPATPTRSTRRLRVAGGRGRVYVGCEAAAMRRIRAAIVESSGLDRKRIITRGYWRIGAVNHPDRDYAED